MPTNQPVALPVTWNQVAAFRLARHHLTERAPVHALAAVAGDIAGVQAQLLSAAQIGFWARITDLRMGDMDQAIRDRVLVKAACMRQTQFLVPSEQLAIFTRGQARRAEKDIRWMRGKGVPDRIIDAAIEATLEAMDQPRTRPEIADMVCRSLGVPLQAIHGGVGWGSRKQVAAVPVGDIHVPVVYLLHLVAARGVFCSGPNHGNEPTFVRADAWIPGWQDVPVEQAEKALLHKYLRAFGPATAADYSMWSGITLTEVRAIWAREQAKLAQVNVEGWASAVLDEDLDILANASYETPLVRLLPYFDTFLLGHKQRDHLAAQEHQPRIYRAQGWIAPVVLADGRPVAVWEYARERKSLLIKVVPFGFLSPEVINGMQEEARSLGQFLGVPSVDIQIS